MPGKNKSVTPKFKGRIVDSSYDFQSNKTDIIGNHRIWYPKTKVDVSIAVKILQNHSIIVKSGIQSSNNDIIDGENKFVINLTDLNKVSVDNNILKIESGANIKTIIEHLISNKLVLPISDNLFKSIVSNIKRESSSHFVRSLGSLSNYITSIDVVKSNGSRTTIKSKKDTSCLTQCLSINAIITQIKFKAVSVKPFWISKVSIPYIGKKKFLKLLDLVFIKINIPKNVDLIVESYNGVYSIPLIKISIIGKSNNGKTKIKRQIQNYLNKIFTGFEKDVQFLNFKGNDIYKSLLESESGSSFDSAINTTTKYNAYKVSNMFLEKYAEKVHNGIGFSSKNTGKINKDAYIHSAIQLNEFNKLEIKDSIHTMNLSLNESEFVPFKRTLRNSNYLMSHSLTKIYESYQNKLKDIPEFNGEIYKSTDYRFNKLNRQYATSSYDSSQMTPFIIAYPIDEKDIKSALSFAKTTGKKVVARSGGHQYSGKSSGGKDTIVLSMDNFKHFHYSHGIAIVGSALRLTDLAKKFKELQITVPHGECPYVAIGGHAQTGGYGHLVRNFGLLLDYVHSFDIILADGKNQTVTRPKPKKKPKTELEKLNQELFWAVLGGNAGSFGIVTSYKLNVIRDRDFPNSYGFSSSRKYSNKSFLSMMKEVQKCTLKIKDGTLDKGIDLMITVASKGRSPLPVILTELVHADMPFKDSEAIMPQDFSSIAGKAKRGLKFWEKSLIVEGKRCLSELSDSFVRRWPVTTLDGREFSNPYKKRVNCTNQALSNKFIIGFVELITKAAVGSKGIQLIFQMLLGGGEYQNSKVRKDTSIPHRDYVFCFVFDLFYSEGYKQNAIELQNEMQVLVDRHFSPIQEFRVFWGTFGEIAETSINDLRVRRMYYDSEAKYEKLQQIKNKVDPQDIFHTSLTVKLP